MLPVIEPTLDGFLLSLSLIVAIGAQNTFVLRQGLIGRHVFWLCLFCGLSDAILISAGVLTFATASSLWEELPRYLAFAGAAFLLAYGATRFRAAQRGNYDFLDGASAQSLSATLVTAAALTWANPHVYLDTFGLIGAVSTGYSDLARLGFGLGAVTGSFLFFFSLGYGSRLLSPLFVSRRAWRILDVTIGLVMWWIAYSLILQFT